MRAASLLGSDQVILTKKNCLEKRKEHKFCMVETKNMLIDMKNANKVQLSFAQILMQTILELNVCNFFFLAIFLFFDVNTKLMF